MQGKAPEQEIEEALTLLNIDIGEELLKKYGLTPEEEENKALKKKLKKYQIDAGDSSQKTVQKINKLLDELSKNFEVTGKQFLKMRQAQSKVEAKQIQYQKANNQKLMIETLFNNFKKRYDQELKNADQTEKDQEIKRKQIIEQLQERIKLIQSQYEEAGKIKIQKFKQNQTLKHQLSKYEPHLVASQSLADAQLKKKSIEIEIQMTTLKQKIQMMSSFKNMREQTEEKVKKSKQVEEKLEKRLNKLAGKQDQHKISLARAHLVFEDYKKAFNVLKVTLPQKEREALLANDKVKKANQSLQQLKKKIQDLDKEFQTHSDQLDMLKKLESQLQKQLEE